MSLQCLCGRGMVLTLIVVLATFVLVRSEECFYEYNYGTGYMDYWCDDSYATFDEYVPDVTAPPSPPPTPPPPPPAFPTNHCRGGLPILSNQGRGGVILGGTLEQQMHSVTGRYSNKQCNGKPDGTQCIKDCKGLICRMVQTQKILPADASIR